MLASWLLRVIHVSRMADKPKRLTRSWEPKPDVAAMLDRAKAEGITMSFVVNNAAREWLTKKGYARKKDLAEVNGK